MAIMGKARKIREKEKKSCEKGKKARKKEKKSCEKRKKAREKEKKSCEKGKNSSLSTPWTIGMMVHGSPYEKRSALSSLQKTKRSAYGLGRKGSTPCSLLISTFWP